MKIINTLLSLFIVSSFSFAQWKKVEAIKSSIVYSALFSGDNIYVGTDSLYISSDRGLTWESKIISPQPLDITSMCKIDNQIFAGTYGAGIYLSTDDGHTWNSLSTGLGGFANYASVFALSGDTIFYGSDGGGIYFYNSNINYWQSYNQNLPSNYAWTINDITVTNSNLIASAGGSGYYYLRPKGSPQWIEKSIQTPGGALTTPNVLLAFGDTVFSGSRWGIYRSIDNGYTWDSVGIRGMPVDAVELIKDKNRIYAGFTRAAGNDFYVWYSDDYGLTWEIFDHQFQYLHHLYIYDNKIWAATNDGLWFRELNPTNLNPIDNPASFKLEQNYPNPFNPFTNIRFTINKAGVVSLKVYDVLGNEIALLVNQYQPSGTYDISFDASHLSSGIYFYQLQTEDYKAVKKMILVN